MANYFEYFAGTAKTWLNTGGDYAMTLHNKTNTTGQQGAKGDFYNATYGNPSWLEFWLEWSGQATPTNGAFVEVWAGESDSATAGTNNPGTLDGTDNTVTTVADYKYQLSWVGAMRLVNTTNVQKQSVGILVPKRRYICPVVVNLSGVTSTNTAGNFKLQVTPWYRRVN